MSSRLDASVRGAFIGRTQEMRALDALAEGGAWLVTIAGAGGVGKTRLAVEWARRASNRDEPVVCELAGARDLDEACAIVARALGTPLAAGASSEQAVEQLGQALASAGERLVVLDNFEQLTASSPRMLHPLRARAPGARFLVTSRERLRIEGEACLALDPLGVPRVDDASFDEISASDAVRLFVERARAARFGYELTADDAPAVAAIVQQLDGIPLAIELCAARIGVLSPAQILARLARRFDLLAIGPRGAPARQATLRGAVDWSWDLLEPDEKHALSQCAVFRGGFSVEAAEGVLELEASAGASSVLDVLQALCDKSLVRAFDAPGSPAARRYDLLETIRAYAEERLVERGGLERAVARHATFFLTSIHRGGAVFGLDDVRKVALEADNLVAVAKRALARQPLTAEDADVALRALLLVEPVLLGCARGRLAPYVAMLDAALSAPSGDSGAATSFGGAPPDVVRARATYTRGLADLLRGRVLDGMLGFQRAQEAARAAGSRADEARALTKLGVLFDLADREDEGRRRFEEARVIARETGDPALAGDWALAYAGALLWRGRSADALAHAEQARDSLRAAGDVRGQSIACAQIAQASLSLGRYDDAERVAGLTLDLLHATQDRRTEAFVLSILGRVDQARGRFEDARRKLSQAIAIHHGVGDRLSAGVARGYLGNVAWEVGELDEADAAYREALALLRDTGERHYATVFVAALRALEAMRGRPDAPSDRSSSGVASRVSVPSAEVAVHLYAGFAEVAEARRAALAGDPARAEQHRTLALARRALAHSPARDGALSAAEMAEDVRLALRLLERAAAAPLAPGASDAALRPSPKVLVVGPDARWFRFGDAEPVHLLKGRAARLVLHRLVRFRIEAPGRAVALDALFEAGWPGERIARRAASNRVHVTLTKLRKLGLASLLQSRDDGFLLDPARVVVEAVDADRG